MEKSFVTRFLEEIATYDGYKAYAVNGYDTFGYVITPRDNVLVVNSGDFGGVHFTFAYIPCCKNGSGCSCNDDSYYGINREELEKLEKDGLNFAKSLKAKLYENSREWYESSYWKNQLVRL
jgi:hypothetical protein